MTSGRPLSGPRRGGGAGLVLKIKAERDAGTDAMHGPGDPEVVSTLCRWWLSA